MFTKLWYNDNSRNRKEGVIDMEYFIRVLSFAIIPIIVSGVLAFLRQPKKAEKGKVYLPKFFALIGLLTATVFLIPTIITAFSDEPIWVSIVFFAFSLLCTTLIIAFINCRVTYDEDGFVAKNFFGVKRKFTYDQVTGIKENMHEDYIYIGKRKAVIDEFSVGGTEFIAYVRKRYRTMHNGQTLPEIRKTKHDIFNGNVNDVFGFMFAYILISVFIVAFAIFLVWSIYFTPSTIDNTIEQEVIFASCDIKKDEIVLITSDNQLYKIRRMGEGINTEGIESICDGKTSVTTYSKQVTPDDEEDYYSVKAILREDTYLLSFEETNRWHREEYQLLLLFPVVFAILWGSYIAGSIIVGRNPKKYSKKIVRLFFKDGYVNTD